MLLMMLRQPGDMQRMRSALVTRAPRALPTVLYTRADTLPPPVVAARERSLRH